MCMSPLAVCAAIQITRFRVVFAVMRSLHSPCAARRLRRRKEQRQKPRHINFHSANVLQISRREKRTKSGKKKFVSVEIRITVHKFSFHFVSCLTRSQLRCASRYADARRPPPPSLSFITFVLHHFSAMVRQMSHVRKCRTGRTALRHSCSARCKRKQTFD